MGVQSGGRPNFENCGIPNFWVLGKMSFGCSPMVSHIEYYKGEGGGFPQV
jgi:hypothetical protein